MYVMALYIQEVVAVKFQSNQIEVQLMNYSTNATDMMIC